MTPELRGIYQGVFAARPGEPCPECGGFHLRACPRVKRQVWHPNGNRTEVEYWPPGTWEDQEIIWPEDVFEEDDDGRPAGPVHPS
jgi:hypothetical protein